VVVLSSFNLKKKKGFTLIELSIVIVIIGLIVAGVVGGQSLVRQAKIRSLISDYNKYQIAMNTFKLEYSSLAGDLSNASNYGIGNDGNGDKRIFHENSEVLYAWQHLGAANLVQGTYTGADAGNPDDQIGVNVPKTSFGDSVTAIFSYLTDSVSGGNDNCLGTNTSLLFGLHGGFNVLSFGKLQDIHDNCPVLPFLKVAEAHGIDNKIDDGLADSGILFSANQSDTNNDGNRCVDNNVRGTGGANYDFDETGVTCRLIFKLGR